MIRAYFPAEVSDASLHSVKKQIVVEINEEVRLSADHFQRNGSISIDFKQLKPFSVGRLVVVDQIVITVPAPYRHHSSLKDRTEEVGKPFSLPTSVPAWQSGETSISGFLPSQPVKDGADPLFK